MAEAGVEMAEVGMSEVEVGVGQPPLSHPPNNEKCGVGILSE